MSPRTLPRLPDTWDPTRATLHAYALAVGAMARAYAIAHPKWWHISLKIRPGGLVTDVIPIPQGGSAEFRLDLVNHEIVLAASSGARVVTPMNQGLSGSEVGDALIAAAATLGLEGGVARERFENDETRPYDETTARLMFAVFTDVASAFERHRATLDGPVGPVQIWPHGFDLAFEWYGTRTEAYEEDGKTVEHPSQLNLGFYPAGDPYFYSNPWPFEAAKLTTVELPKGAAWHTEGWEGSMLPYAAIAEDPNGLDRLGAYARAVYDAAAPTLV